MNWFSSLPINSGRIPKVSLAPINFSSETCALDIIGAQFVREVENGEVVVISGGEIESIRPFPNRQKRPCIFEYIYFARPDMNMRPNHDFDQELFWESYYAYTGSSCFSSR